MHMLSCHMSQRAMRRAAGVLASGHLSEGDVVREFERRLGEDLGLGKNVVCTNSGTSALFLALAVAGVGPGDEVILPPQTFVATAVAVKMHHATPVFCDVHPTSGLMCGCDLARKTTERTRAVIPVHWAGIPCNMDQVRAVTDRHEIVIVEDACQALGATYHGKPVGTLGHFGAFGCFSFQATKHVTCGDGGAVVFCHADSAGAGRRARWFGIDREEDKEGFLGEREYTLLETGYKMHMNDLAAAVGLGNLEGFSSRLLWRRAIAARYAEALAGIDGVEAVSVPAGAEPSWYVYSVLVDRRDDFIRAMRSRGVPCSVMQTRIDRHPAFGGLRDLPGMEAFEARKVCLPVHDALDGESVDRVINAVIEGW